MNKKPVIGLTMGDAAGIGPELLGHAFSNHEICDSSALIGIGDLGVLKQALLCIGSGIKIRTIKSPSEADFKNSNINLIDMANLNKEDFAVGKAAARTGRASVEYTQKAVVLAMNKEIDAIVSSPANKEAMNLAGYKYPGQTELIAELAGVKQVEMMLIFGPIRLFYVSNHVPFADIIANVNKNKILLKLEFIKESLKKFGIDSPRVAVAGINPHAGEGGRIRREESDEILPAIESARKKGIYAEGPFPADTIFPRCQNGEYDAVLVMYHDQGNIAVKLLGFGLGVTLILGVPFIRTSVAHGTAYDIAGKGIAKPDTFFKAIRVAISLVEKTWRRKMEQMGEARIPTSEFKGRVTELQAEMSEKNIDVVFLYANDYFSENLRYLTDYWPHIEQAGAIIPKRGTVLILAAPEGEPYANEMKRIGQVRNVKEFMIPNEDYPFAKYWTFKELLNESADGKKIKRLGMIGMDIIPFHVYNQVKSSIGDNAEVMDCESIIREMRKVKSKNEILMIKKSYEIAGNAINRVIPMVKPGISEIDVAREIEYEIRKNGCEWFAYRAPIMSGKRVNTVLGCATNKKLKSGEIFILAAGAKYEGYCSAYGRTLVIGGKPTKEQRRFIETGLKAEELAMEKLGPDKRAKEVDIAGREYLKKEGLGMYHLYSIGHGLGLTECNEGPHCTKDTDYILKPGNVISLDVGLFGVPKHYGLRSEDGYVITEKGYERLSRAVQKSLI